MINYAILSDIHFKAVPNNQLMLELSKAVKVMESLDKLDLIAITGDYFHKKLDSNTDVSVALKFMYVIIQIAKDKGAKIRIIKGTHSHDLDQLNMFMGLDDVAEVDLQVINHASDEFLFEDFRVLYLPEEYVTDYEEYYNELLLSKENTYNMILGHGMVDIGAFYAKVQESEETRRQAPVFKFDELYKACPQGPIYFGHIHTPMTHWNFKYVGSYSVWAFGEEETKGFYIGSYDKEKGEFNDIFIENDLRRIYSTVNILEDSGLYQYADPHDILKQLDTIIEGDEVSDFIRIKMTIPTTYDQAMLLSQLVDNAYKSHKRVTSVKVYSTLVEQKTKQGEKEVSDLLNEYSYLFSNTLTIPEKIAHHIKKKWGSNIELKRLIEMISDSK